MLTFPLLVTLALVVPLLVLYLSPLYALTLRSAVASGVAGTVVALTGFVYYWSRFRARPHAARATRTSSRSRSRSSR